MSRKDLQKDFEYPLLEPPFEVKPFEEMTRAETSRYFEWFVRQSQPRCELLLRAVQATGGPYEALDYSPESLVPLWDWARQFMEAEEPRERECAAFWRSLPPWAQRAGIRPRQLTVGTMCLCIDIGFYLAELFMRKWEGLGWALCTEKTIHYNRPCLRGFRTPLVPNHVVAMCAWSAVEDDKDGADRLYRCFLEWEKDLA